MKKGKKHPQKFSLYKETIAKLNSKFDNIKGGGTVTTRTKATAAQTVGSASNNLCYTMGDC